MKSPSSNNSQNNQLSPQSQNSQSELGLPKNLPGADLLKVFFDWLEKRNLGVFGKVLTPIFTLTWLLSVEIPTHHQQARSDAWKLISSSSEQSGDGGKDLRGVNLNNANLVGVNLTGANLAGSTLTNANLTNAQLKDANLDNTNLENANLGNVKNLCSAKMLAEKIAQLYCENK